MEKSVTVIGRVASGSASRAREVESGAEERKDHLKVWREIYQDVRRQWAEAESTRPRSCRDKK